MSETRNCARVRECMIDGAGGSLARRRVEFDTHLRQCTGCREEFQRAQMLLRAIDEGVRASVALEPSRQLEVNVRQAIAAQGRGAPQWWRQRTAWLTASGACATLAVILFAVVTLRKFDSPLRDYARRPIAARSTPNHPVARSNHDAGVESAARAQRRKPELVLARRKAPHRIHRRPSGPEILAEPGQMKAVMLFAAEVQQGKINGAEIEAEIKASEKPLEIKPLVIPPLATPESVGKAAEGPAASNLEQKFTSEGSN